MEFIREATWAVVQCVAPYCVLVAVAVCAPAPERSRAGAGSSPAAGARDARVLPMEGPPAAGAPPPCMVPLPCFSARVLPLEGPPAIGDVAGSSLAGSSPPESPVSPVAAAVVPRGRPSHVQPCTALPRLHNVARVPLPSVQKAARSKAPPPRRPLYGPRGQF